MDTHDDPSLAVGIPQMVLYIYYGDIILNLIMCMLTMFVAACAIRGLAYRRTESAESKSARTPLYIAIVIMVALEYALWTSSCFWTSSGLDNPYYWCDFLLTAVFVAIFPLMRKAVSHD